ncbi:ABC transporter substrate-binding protein [Promicromonospora sp. CA-289599]|uniref:ABC transporter substrate-binding protein n=1 Tax=Promicromonospora sp. CA-289599 TaxID=3240014 RepID=UPI003D8CCADE
MQTSKKTLSARRVGAVAAVATASLLLAACAPGSQGGATTGDATAGSITWWGWTPDAINAEKLIAAFNEEYPDIEVEFVSKPIDSYDSVLSPAITSSDGPDVFNVAPGSANGGVDTFGPGAIDLKPAVEEALGPDWSSKVSELGVSGLTVDDKLVGLSAGAVYSGNLWINQGIFEKYDLEPPTDLASWKQVCDTLEAAGEGCFVQGAGQWAFDMDTFEAIVENIEPGLYQKATVGEASFTEGDSGQKFTRAMEAWKSLFDEGIMQEGAVGLQQYPDANNEFMQGKYAMIMMGSWYTQYAVKDSMVTAMEAAGVSDPEPITLVPVDFPDLAGTGNVGNMFGDADYGLAVSGRSDNQAAATTFVTWLATSQTGQQSVADTLNNIPALAGITPDWDQIDLVDPEAQADVLSAYTETAAASTQPRFATVSAELNTAFRDALVGVAGGDTSIPDALQTLQGVAAAE